VQLSPSALQLLRDGVRRIRFSSGEAGEFGAGEVGVRPAFLEAGIAFGLPDVSSILQSEKLRWVHLTSAGYTRYDTAEFVPRPRARVCGDE